MVQREESVRVSLIDDFSTKAAKIAASAALIEKRLNDLDGSGVNAGRGLAAGATGVDGLDASARRADPSINQLTGRLRLMADAAVTLGPALIPIGGVGVAAVAGLASQASLAAIAGGSMLVAFQGVGDALKLVEEARLDPTVENLEKAREAMAALGPDAAKFVTAFQEFRPVLRDIRDGAAAGWFPGLTESLTSFEALAPKVITLFEAIGRAGGDAIADGAASLASDRWTDFFDFLATEAPATITSLGKIIGDLAHGAAEMWMAFQPLNNSFTGWLQEVADGFDDWASSAAGRQGITDFMDYVRETAPAVGQAFGSLIDAFTQITQAAAPLGGPVLRIVTVFAEALASIADSPIGTPLFAAIAAMSAFSRASKIMDVAAAATSGALDRMGASATTASRGMSALRGAGQIAAGLLLVAAATRSINDATRDVLPGLDTMMRDLRMGAEEQGASKLSRDFSDLGDSIERLYAKTADQSFGDAMYTPFKGLFGETGSTQEAMDEIAAIDAALAGLVDTEGPQVAAAALDDLYQSGLLTKEQLALLSANLPEYQNALDRAATATEAAANSTQSLAAQERAAAAAIKAGVEALRAKTQAALGAFDAETQYRQALKAAREQGEKNNAGIRGSSEAAIANRQVIGQLAAAWNNQSDAVKNNAQKFRESRSTFIETATAMGVPIGQAKRLADSILDIPKARATKISAETAAAEARIAAINRSLNGIDGKRVATYIDTFRTTINRQVGPAYNAGGIPGSASGSTVPKDGGPYADRFPYMLAPGEEVISNRHGQADRHRSLLKAINAGALASGGTAGIDGLGWSRRADGLSWAGVNQGLTSFSQALSTLGDRLDVIAADFDTSSDVLRSNVRDMRAHSRELGKQVETLQKVREAEKSRLADLKAERASFAASVAGNFAPDPFGSIDLQAAAESGAFGTAFTDAALAFANKGSNLQGGEAVTEVGSEQIAAYLASLSSQTRSQYENQVRFSALNQQANDANNFNNYLDVARANGLDGGLFQQLAASGQVGAAELFASFSADEIANYERQFGNAQQAALGAGNNAANAEFGAAIRAQTRITAEAREIAREALVSQRRAEKRLERLEALLEKAPKETGREVGNAIDKTAADTKRGGR